MIEQVFPQVVLRWGPIGLTDTMVASAALSFVLVGVAVVGLRIPPVREVFEVVYEFLESTIERMVEVDARPLIPLVLTQWIFILTANLVGLVPRIASPTRDLSLAVALAVIAWIASHVYAARQQGWGYLRHYVEPNPLLLPFNLIGEVSRTIALALRLFGNMLSATLVGAVVLYLAAFLVPVPLMLLGVLTGAVQAYIFGVLTLVFSVSAVQTLAPREGAGSGHETVEDTA